MSGGPKWISISMFTDSHTMHLNIVYLSASNTLCVYVHLHTHAYIVAVSPVLMSTGMRCNPLLFRGPGQSGSQRIRFWLRSCMEHWFRRGISTRIEWSVLSRPSRGGALFYIFMFSFFVSSFVQRIPKSCFPQVYIDFGDFLWNGKISRYSRKPSGKGFWFRF